jgi:hypothetical protein
MADRDYPSADAERFIKRAALASAEAYNCGTQEQLEECETLLLAACLSMGLLNMDEYLSVDHIGYDGVLEARGCFHHVYIYVDPLAPSVLDIVCDQ